MKKLSLLLLSIIICLAFLNAYRINIYAEESYLTDKITHIYSEKNGKMIGSLDKGFVLKANNIIKREDNWIKIIINYKKLYLESWIRKTNLKQELTEFTSNSGSNKEDINKNFKISNVKYKKQPGIGLVTFLANIKNTTNKSYESLVLDYTVYDGNDKKIDNNIIRLNSIKPYESRYISGNLYANPNEIDHYKLTVKKK